MYGATQPSPLGGNNAHEINIASSSEDREENVDVHSKNNSNKSSRSTVLSVVLACIIASLLFVAASTRGLVSFNGQIFSSLKASKNNFGEGKTLPNSNEVSYVSYTELYFTASNEYGVFDAPYPWLEDGSQLVEPYKNTTLTVSGTIADSGDYDFLWEIELDDEKYYGSSINVVFTKTKSYTVRIHSYDNKGNYYKTLKGQVYCKYVKREIRTLTEDDRERFLDAAHALWEYDSETGRKLFGDKFTSISTLVAEHSIASNDIMCDQFHEGSGFLTHHLALQNSFEASMRAVDPSVTLPYWDFTIEGQTIQDLGENPSYLLDISPVFTKTWFGSVDEFNHIKDSRWAHAIMPVAEDKDMTQNSYGYIRSYWNNNPDPEVSRHLFDACGLEPTHKAIPYCKMHYDILNSESLAALQLLSPGDGHGPMHVQIGGMWGGCTDAYLNFTSKWGYILDEDMSDEDITNIGYTPGKTWKWGNVAPRREMFNKAVMGEYFHIYRSFWRSHMCAEDNTPALLECPEECDKDNDPFETCTCSVNKLTSGETDWKNIFPCVLNSESNRGYFNASMPEEMLEDMTTFLATAPVLEGEMIESASTADIMFWIIHPVIERLVSAKRLPGVTAMGTTNFTKWDVVDGSNETFLEYSYYSLEAGDNSWYPDEYTCVGHGRDDRVLPEALPFTDAISKIADTNGDGYISNWEFLVALDPNNQDGNDYVFDNFKWDHCNDVDLTSK